ncbi:MAG TPA: S8 family serine peptidase [Propionibacteriaceae bacterium]
MKKHLLATTAALSALLTATVALPPAAAAPGSPARGSSVKRYIVQTETSSGTDGLAGQVRRRGGNVKHVYSRVFSGFSATMTTAQADDLQSDPRVESVTPDAVVRSTATQTNPTWGLDRIDQRSTKGNKTYRYDTTGAGVTAFVLDTGVRFSQRQFGGRARSGRDFVDLDGDASDCAGHGTHVAGTIGGVTYGVAKKITLVAVRVLDCEGSGYMSDSIDALDWVIANKPSGPSVVNLSLGGEVFPLLDRAVERTVAAGIPVVVAAGNDDQSACNQSPARAPRAITVAATARDDRRADFSNYGRCVDLFAPGVGVKSASNDSDTAAEYMSGTSMAAPHVTGFVARYLQRHPRASSAATTAAVVAATSPGAVKDRRSGSPNRLLYAPRWPAVPKAPTRVKASKSNKKKEATITWAAPVDNGGQAVTRYLVSRNGKSSTGVGAVTVSVSLRTRGYTFTKLKKGSRYTLSVRAVNATGAGAVVSKKLSKLK